MIMITTTAITIMVMIVIRIMLQIRGIVEFPNAYQHAHVEKFVTTVAKVNINLQKHPICIIAQK